MKGFRGEFQNFQQENRKVNQEMDETEHSELSDNHQENKVEKVEEEFSQIEEFLNAKDDQVDIIKLEEFIDKSIEIEDYELLNLLLDKRERILPKLANEVLKEIYERDIKRQEILREKFENFKNLIKQLESGKKFAQSYIQNEDKGNLLNSKG
ncbi:MAG: hypothetical protein ACK4R7_04660 [Fervidobacterium sp.]